MDQTVARAQAGDTAAFERLYRQHVGRVYALCLRLEGDPPRAEELTQDVFVRAWERLGSFRGESAFSSWLHRLAVNVVFGAQRSEGRRRSMERAAAAAGAALPAASGAPPGVRLDLEQALEKLPQGARQVFVLHDVEGFEHREIGRIMGIAPGTSKAQLHRARRLLREALNG